MSSYEDYESTLQEMVSLGAERMLQDAAIAEAFERSIARAHELPRHAARRVEAATNQIHVQQEEGRAALAAIGQLDLLPARVRPGKSAGHVTDTDLDELLKTHAHSIRQLEASINRYKSGTDRALERQRSLVLDEAEETRRRRELKAAEERRREDDLAVTRNAVRLRRVRLIVASAIGSVLLVVVIFAIAR